MNSNVVVGMCIGNGLNESRFKLLYLMKRDKIVLVTVVFLLKRPYLSCATLVVVSVIYVFHRKFLNFTCK